ncbi:MAG: Asp-tRNA(Asn)/Glu-tRNA(Gln) amidotransferase subunit GatC [bacterium]
MGITKKEVEHVCLLARLKLEEEEKEEFTHQLNNILNYADKINELDTQDTPPTSHPLALTNVMREDEVQNSLPVDEVLANAPDEENQFFKVPRIIGE